MNDSSTVYVAKLHWLLFVSPILLALISLFVGFEFQNFGQLSSIFLLFSLIWLLAALVNYAFSSLTIERKRVIFRTGILVRKITDIPYTKIESIDIRQSILGSILQYGSLMVTGTGGTRHFINYLSKPLTCRRYIEHNMHDQI